MRVSLTSRQAAFQREVERFLADALPPTVADKVERGEGVDRAELSAWTRILDERGWAAPHWPVEHGGTGWSLVERHLFDMACRAAHAPALSGFGLNMVGPAIIRYGTAEQQARFLPATRRGDLWWCQGYSEPQAGSDLASLRTRAERVGDEYVVNGQKIWTSAAESADWIFCLVRTNPDVQAQRGISFLLIDMANPGITVEPLIAFNGKRLWNQVFFTDVTVPVGNRLGEEDRGWSVAKSLLGDERLMVSRVAENSRLLARLRELAGTAPDGAQPVGASHAMQRKIAELDIRLRALETTSLRLLTTVDEGRQVGAEPSMLKLRGSTLVQAFDELLFETAGYWGLAQDGGGATPPVGPRDLEYVASGMFHHRGYTIAGGSSEIQRNIIAKEVLGL
ncbi:MAG: acyl-CoA dehydrogenase family protein [Pseudomonadales bacterium]|nr:acyl-CoA dehydrogenase family protein [Pseudomonadales bacterium]